MSSLKRYEGYLLTDHRAGPGLGSHYPNGMKVEEATLWCGHCGTPFLHNPDRQRERNYCRVHDCYVCDPCTAASTLPGYVHRSFNELADIVRSGRFTLHGPLSNPVLVPTLKEL